MKKNNSQANLLKESIKELFLNEAAAFGNPKDANNPGWIFTPKKEAYKISSQSAELNPHTNQWETVPEKWGERTVYSVNFEPPNYPWFSKLIGASDEEYVDMVKQIENPPDLYKAFRSQEDFIKWIKNNRNENILQYKEIYERYKPVVDRERTNIKAEKEKSDAELKAKKSDPEHIKKEIERWEKLAKNPKMAEQAKTAIAAYNEELSTILNRSEFEAQIQDYKNELKSTTDPALIDFYKQEIAELQKKIGLTESFSIGRWQRLANIIKD